jgi:hypothetical protein
MAGRKVESWFKVAEIETVQLGLHHHFVVGEAAACCCGNSLN